MRCISSMEAKTLTDKLSSVRRWDLPAPALSWEASWLSLFNVSAQRCSTSLFSCHFRNVRISIISSAALLIVLSSLDIHSCWDVVWHLTATDKIVLAAHSMTLSPILGAKVYLSKYSSNFSANVILSGVCFSIEVTSDHVFVCEILFLWNRRCYNSSCVVLWSGHTVKGVLLEDYTVVK